MWTRTSSSPSSHCKNPCRMQTDYLTEAPRKDTFSISLSITHTSRNIYNGKETRQGDSLQEWPKLGTDLCEREPCSVTLWRMPVASQHSQPTHRPHGEFGNCALPGYYFLKLGEALVAPERENIKSTFRCMWWSVHRTQTRKTENGKRTHAPAKTQSIATIMCNWLN